MLVNVKFVLWKVLIKVLLENLKANCVSIFMFSIVVSILLQAVIGEMHVVVLILERVIVRAGPQIALLVVIELVLVWCISPHSDIELSPFEQHWLLNVLLNHPVGIELPRGEELLNLLQTVKDLYAAALVHVCRLHKPIVFFAMLLRSLLFDAGSLVFLKVHVSRYKLMKLVCVQLRSNDKGCRRSIEDTVACLN